MITEGSAQCERGDRMQTPEPKAVFGIFEEICAIPHGSGNAEAICAYCLRFAERLGLSAQRDAADNIVIRKPASSGYEDHAPVILQAHLDMVTEKTADCEKDLDREGLTLGRDGDRLFAEKTTLGADDGIGVALALAVLADKTLAHPPIEVLLTSDEEIGMLGAAELDAMALQGRRMLNLDEEEEGVFTAGCAGGASALCRIPTAWESRSTGTYELTVSGLTGGHSGMEIQKGGANACILMGRILRELNREAGLRLVDLNCEGKDNAIAVACTARFTLLQNADIYERAAGLQTQLRKEYAADPDLCLTLREGGTTECVMTDCATRRCLDFLLLVPNGVMEMSRTLSGLVQTSLNLGVLHTTEHEMTALFAVRSSVAAQKKELLERLETLCGLLGGSTVVRGDYPAWEYRADSEVRTAALEVYRELTGKEPRVNVTHAGLECGLLAEKLPGLDAVAFGPSICGAHTPRESLSIASTETVWNVLKELLRRL
ncbi:MAG: aminoacyl-histidine dipeptidase [Oscillospiraceae bacterium]|nr:aminoacyl-histidine dipeptidase [Oscillospiraceae bacterium]